MSDHPDYPRVIQVIECSMARRGKGIEGDPMRVVRQYFTLAGELLAEVDPWMDDYIREMERRLNNFEAAGK